MRILEIYKFDELSDNAKKIAIVEVREELKENDSPEWAFRSAIDDCALFEPAHVEMAEMFGDDYTNSFPDNGFLFKNIRKDIRYDEFDYDLGKAIVYINDAMIIQNDTMFKKWLGIPESLMDNVTYKIKGNQVDGSRISLKNTYPTFNPMHPVLNDVLVNATNKFDRLLGIIGNRIKCGVEDYYSDEELIERFENGNNNYEFTKDGKLYNS
jgi:hypothetical protein